MIKIGIDARFYGPLGKGLGRYTQEVVDNIIKISQAELNNSPLSETNFQYVIFLSPENFDEFLSTTPQVKKVKLPYRWYSLAEQVFFPFYIRREKLDLIHFTHFNVPIFTFTKFIVTIHDLILTHFPTVRATTHNYVKYFLKNIAYRLVIFFALKRSQKIITVSKFSRNDIIKQFNINPSKIVVTYEGVSSLIKRRDSLFVAKLDKQETLDQYHIRNRFLLYVGNAYPHKNLEMLIKVFNRLHFKHPELHLVLVGQIDYFYERIKKLAESLNLWQNANINNPVLFLGYVPDDQLKIIYSEAQVYIFPSFYEGFGLPPLEAMSQSCPVLSSNRSSLPEILGSAALYFDPYDFEDIINKVELILGDDDLREDLKKKGIEQIKKYDWWECARKTLQVYYEVLGFKY